MLPRLLASPALRSSMTRVVASHSSPSALSLAARRAYSAGHAEETYEQFTSRYIDFFAGVEDLYELQRGLNNCFSYDLVPAPEVVDTALRAARRINDFATAVRILEALKLKVEEPSQYDAYLKALAPTREELGIPTREELDIAQLNDEGSWSRGESTFSSRLSLGPDGGTEEEDSHPSYRLAPRHSKTRVQYFQHPDVANYHYGDRHPMKPHRLALTAHLVLGYGLHHHMDMFAPREATREELEAFHAPDYLDFLSRVSPTTASSFSSSYSRYNIGDDCPIFDGMYDFCRLYAGSSIEAARRLNASSTDVAINWSGGLHHAKKAEASGFCYVNDIVLAALELLRYHPRVLYVDIDIHHGDGVQEAFFTTDRVMTVSFHKYNGDFFPGTGPMSEVGLGDGEHYALNIPLDDGVDDAQYVYLFKSVMEGVMQSYRPSAIILQCGADSLGCDRLGVFNLSIQAHGECVRFMKDFGLPTIVVGGGGYTIRNVSRCWAYETSIILGRRVPDTLPYTVYHEYFSPDYRLHPKLSGRVDNQNTYESIEKIRIEALECLRYLPGAPSVQMNEVPRMCFADWQTEGELEVSDREIREDTGAEGTRDSRLDPHTRESTGWYDSAQDHDGNGRAREDEDEDEGSMMDVER